MKRSRDIPIAVISGLAFASLSLTVLKCLYPEISLVFLGVVFPGAALTYGASMHWMLTKTVGKKSRRSTADSFK